MSEERLMKTPEEVRQKARELLQMPKEEVLTKYMFQEQEIERLRLELLGYRQAILQDKEMLGLKQENERLNNIINKIENMFNRENLNQYYYGMSYEFEINDFKDDIFEIIKGSE